MSTTRVTSEGLEKDFPDLFKDDLGTFTGQPHHSVVDSGTCPTAVGLRPAPVAGEGNTSA
ncbi:MAG: hypothetical protein GY696_13105 [Gammaproteobacteria bacterium]|nr:hypothetical protein [Gammaproteobacteria bacterium]